jgi:hypothetical protein
MIWVSKMLLMVLMQLLLLHSEVFAGCYREIEMAMWPNLQPRNMSAVGHMFAMVACGHA